MKIAYLITAYIDPEQLARLVRVLTPSAAEQAEGMTAAFYIHIDSKVDIAPFRQAVTGLSSVTFAAQRYWINWGGFNQVLAYKQLLTDALAVPGGYDRYVCLSATDYPLWSRRKIYDTFDANPQREYVGAYRIPGSKDFQQVQKVRYYHFFRDLQLPLRMKRALCFASRRLMRILPLRKPLTFVGSSGTEYDAYTGSDYWALTHYCAAHALDVMEHDVKFMDYFRTSYIPSENVIPTIVMNSRFAANVAIHCTDEMYPGLEALTPLQYTQYRGAIKVYKLDDWDELHETDRMFFRKARTGVSDSLLDRLDKENGNSKVS